MIHPNTLHLGDCLQIMAQLPDNSVDCVVTDPPYKYLKNQKLETDFDEALLFSQLKRVLKKDSMLAIFGRGVSFYRWCTMLNDLGFEFKEEIVWDKRHVSSPVTAIGRVHELCAVFSLGNGKIQKNKIPYTEVRESDFVALEQDIKRIKSALNNTKELDLLLEFVATKKISYIYDRNFKHTATFAGTAKAGSRVQCTLNSIVNGITEKSIISIHPEIQDYKHPTQKPIRLLERLLALLSSENDLILDPFLGSGTTALACINTNRRFIGCEIDTEYYEIAKGRIEKALEAKTEKLF